MTQKISKFTCPICKKKVARNAVDFPFCSERCRTLDLAHWADGSYNIPGEETAFIPDDDACIH